MTKCQRKIGRLFSAGFHAFQLAPHCVANLYFGCWHLAGDEVGVVEVGGVAFVKVGVFLRKHKTLVECACLRVEVCEIWLCE